MKNELSNLVIRALSGEMPLLTLRGSDAFAREGGDLDYLVPKGHALAACQKVASLAIAENWFLLGFRDIGYLAQIVLIRPNSSEMVDDVLKIDFFDGLCWYGVGEDVSGRRLFEELLSSNTDIIKLAGAVCFFQKIMIVGQLSERDWNRVISTGADAEYLAETAIHLGLPITLDQIKTKNLIGLKKWRFRAASGGATNDSSMIFWLVCAIFSHLKFKSGLGTSAGLILGVSGMDGAGKSTLVNRLVEGMHSAGSLSPDIVHLLPGWIPLPHQLFRREKTKINYTRPYSEPPVSSSINGGIRLAYYFFAFTLASIFLWVRSKCGQLIILDRSFLDFASDLTRARIPTFCVPKWMLRMLMPKGRYLYLDASPENVVARKGELSLEKSRTLQTSYRDVCKLVGASFLNGDNPAELVFKDLLSYLSQEYYERLEVKCK